MRGDAWVCWVACLCVLSARAVQAQLADGLMGSFPLHEIGRMFSSIGFKLGDQNLIFMEETQPSAQTTATTQPTCELDCHWRGRCVDGVCECFNGWGGNLCSEKLPWCPQNCLGHGVCNSETFECNCNSGFRGANCGQVAIVCPSSCSGQGTCNIETGECACFVGFSGADCGTAEPDACPNGCSSRGRCTRGQCICDAGFEGEDCSTVSRRIACVDNCSGRGSCINGQCICHVGFEGVSCATASSTPDVNRCPNHCSGRGVCVNGNCQCAFGWYGNSCSEFFQQCAQNCSGQGSCGPNGKCNCAPGYGGDDCEENLGGDCEDNCNGLGKCQFDPVWGFFGGRSTCVCYSSAIGGSSCNQLNVQQDLSCPKNCSGHGQCVDGICRCNGEFTGSACSIPLFNCPKNCSGHGVCMFGKCSCVRGFAGDDCSIPVKSCPNDCSWHGMCRCGMCECDREWGGIDCSVTCRGNCSFRGECIHGVCHCTKGWTGDVCQMEDSCPNDCNERGNCNDGFCECEPGWSGEDCSLAGEDEHTTFPTCNTALLSNCSGHGICSFNMSKKQVECICEEGFVGVDCSFEHVINFPTAQSVSCDQPQADQCVRKWLAAGCPTSNAVLSAGCTPYAECMQQPHLLSMCPYRQATNQSALSSTTSNSTATQLHNATTRATAIFGEPLDCHDSSAETCMNIWVMAGCPLRGFEPMEACIRWQRCNAQAIRDGRC